MSTTPLTVERGVEVNASPADVWAACGGFDSLHTWHPGIDSTETFEQDGAQFRRVALAGGGFILEKLLERNEAAMHYTYAVIEAPLPIADYVGRITVTPHDDHCVVTWVSEFTATDGSEADLQAAIGGIYDAGLTQLKAMCER